MLIIKLLSGLTLIMSIVWFAAQRDYEPAIAIVTSLLAFIAAWRHDKKPKQQASQSQTVSNNGIGIQAGRDVSVGRIRKKGKTTDAE